MPYAGAPPTRCVHERQTRGDPRRAGLVAIKMIHTAAFFTIGACLAYFAYSSLAKRSDRRAAIAGAVVTGEAMVYALNGFSARSRRLPNNSAQSMAPWPTSTCPTGSRRICRTSPGRSSSGPSRSMPGTSFDRGAMWISRLRRSLGEVADRTQRHRRGRWGAPDGSEPDGHRPDEHDEQ